MMLLDTIPYSKSLTYHAPLILVVDLNLIGSESEPSRVRHSGIAGLLRWHDGNNTLYVLIGRTNACLEVKCGV